MNLLLLLLIIITIIIGIYLHNRYYNYSIQDNGNIEIIQSMPKVVPENTHNEMYNKIKNCSRSNKLVNAYLHKNNISDMYTVQTLKSNIDTKLNTELDTELKTNLNTNYVDILMANSNLNIKIPEKDNPECIGSNNLTTHTKQTKQTEQTKQDKSKTKKIIDWYLRANTEYNETNCDNFDNFELIDDVGIDTDVDTNDTDEDTNINSSIDDTYVNNDIPNLVNKIMDTNNYK